MARGDAIFARCNVDWPSDPRCVLLPDNNARWLNHLMWLWCTKHRSPELPAHYTLEYLAKAASLTDNEVETALRAMGELDLIYLSPDNCLVVHGVTNQQSRLEWQCTEIEGCKNPWKNDRKYLWGKAVPVTPHKGTNGEPVDSPRKSLCDTTVPVTPRNAPYGEEKETEKETEKEERKKVTQRKKEERDKERDKEKEMLFSEEPDFPSGSYEPEFEEFWKDSHRKGSKKKARGYWLKLTPSKRAVAHNRVVNEMKWREARAKADPKYFISPWPDVFRWIRDERFNDELEWLKKNHQRFQEETTRTDPARVAAIEKQRQADLKLAEAQGMTLAEYTLAKAQNPQERESPR